MSNASLSQSSSSYTDPAQSSNATPLPDFISLDKWGDSGFEWEGKVPPSFFERLNTQLNTEHVQEDLQINATLYRHNNVLHLAFSVAGHIWLTCQRCLQPINIDLTDDYDIALLEDDSQARSFDDEQDYLLLDEVMNEQTSDHSLPFKMIIEDEILLKAPMAPKHDDCEMSIDQIGDIPEEEDENPFAALMTLKGKL